MMVLGVCPFPISAVSNAVKSTKNQPNYTEYRGRGMSPNEKTGVMVYEDLLRYYKKSQSNVALSTDYKTRGANRTTGKNQDSLARYEECPNLYVDWAIYYDETIEGNTVTVKYGLSMFDNVQYVDKNGTVTEGKSPIELTASYGDSSYNAGYEVVRNTSGKIRYTTRYYEEKGIIFYIINHSVSERIGEEDDVSILFDYIDQGYVVVTLDFMGDENAVTPYMEQALVSARSLFDSKNADAALKDLKVNTSPNYIYFLPEGCRLERDVWYWDTSVWGVNGTMEKYRDTWDNKIAGTSYDPLKIGKVSTVENLISKVTQKDGETPIEYKLCMNIVYPSQPAEGYEVPVYIQEGTNYTRELNIETAYTRGAYTGFALNGYACIQYDHPYWPFLYRSEYSFDGSGGNYGMSQSSENNARAAVRCARYYADALGYSEDLIGAAGISKATPGLSVLCIKNNKQIPQSAIAGYDTSSYEGDIKENGRVVKSIIQPFMYYDEACSEEVSSDCTVAYISSGGGIERLFGTGSYASYEKIPLLISGGTRDEYNCYNYWDKMVAWMTENNPVPFLPIVQLDQGHTFPVGYDKQFGYERFSAMVKFFDVYLKPDAYRAPEVVWITPTDGTTGLPVSGEWSVGPWTPYGWSNDSYYYDQSIQIKFYDTVDPQSVNRGVIVRTKGGTEVSGEWVGSQSNTLFTFCHSGLIAGTEYVIEVTEDVKGTNGISLEETKQVCFKTEGSYALKPIADTYVSVLAPDRVCEKTETLSVSNSAITLLTFEAESVSKADSMVLKAGGTTEAPVNLAVYALCDYAVDEETLTYRKLTADKAWEEKRLIGKYEVSSGAITMDLSAFCGTELNGDYITFALVSTDELKSDIPYTFSLDFETPVLGTELKDSTTGAVIVDKRGAVTDAGKVDVTINKPSSFYLWRRTGSISSGQIVKESSVASSQVFKVQTKVAESQLIKFYNTVTEGYLTKEDVGKSFRVSFDIRPNRALDMEVGFAAASAGDGSTQSPSASAFNLYGSTYACKVPANEWTTVSCVITISEEMVTRQAGMASLKLTYPAESKNYTPYTYIDNLVVEECTPAMYVESVESGSAKGFTLVTVSRGEALDAPIRVTFQNAMDISTLEKGVAVTNITTGDRIVGEWTEVSDDHKTFVFTTNGLVPASTYAVSTTKKAKTADGTACQEAVIRTIVTEGAYAVRPQVSTVVSIAEPQKHFGLYGDQSMDAETIGIFLFSATSLKNADKTKLRFTLDAVSEGMVEVYVLSGVKADESLCYQSVKSKITASSRMGSYPVKDGAVELDLSILPRLVSGNTVGLAIKLTDSSNKITVDHTKTMLVTYGDQLVVITEEDRPVTDVIYNVADITAAQVTLGTDLTVHYYTTLGRTQTEAKMRITVDGTETVVDGVKRGREYVFSFEGLKPWQMGENIRAELILDDTVIAEKTTYSVAENLKNLMAKTAEDLAISAEKKAELDILAADLLTYGGAAQIYVGHHADNRVDQGVVGASPAVTVAQTWASVASKSKDEAVQWEKSGFDVKTGRLYFQFRVNGGDVIKYQVVIGDEVLDWNACGDGSYTVYKNVMPTAYDHVYRVRLIRDGENVQTVKYSVFSYCYEMQGAEGAEKELATAIYNVACAAKIYAEIQ